MNKEVLARLMKKHCIVDCELEDVIEFVSDLLDAQADELRATDPYAVKTIYDLERAAYNVYELIWCLEEVKSGI